MRARPLAHARVNSPPAPTSARSRAALLARYKHSLLFAPGIGSTLWLAGHIAVKRGDKKSTAASLAAASAVLARGESVLFFVEGTRVADATLGPFKPGAFLAAQAAGVRIVPLTISGARAIMPPGLPPMMLWGDVTVTVHPSVAPPPRETAKIDPLTDAAMLATRTAIASALRAVDSSGGAAGSGSSSGAGGSGSASAAGSSGSGSGAAPATGAAPAPAPTARVEGAASGAGAVDAPDATGTRPLAPRLATKKD